MATTGYVRRATKADREGILSIIPVGEYDGDYLHDYFDMLMDDPLYDALVYVIDDKIVGLGAIFIIDGGLSGALRSGRVRKEYQGRKIILKINDELLRRHPNIKYIVGGTVTNRQAIYENIDKGITKHLMTQKCIFYTGSIHSIPSIANGNVFKILQKRDLQRMFREKEVYPNVFVNDRLVIDSVPYRVLESNVEVIMTEKTRAMVSFRDNPDQTLLTFGSSFRQPTGELFCKIDVYGTISESLKFHILHHLKIAMEITSHFNDVLTVELRTNVHDDKIEGIMNCIGLRNATIGTNRRTVVVCTEIINPLYSKM